MAQRGCCSIPTHTETVRVPHHIYTTHQQPIVNKWVKHHVAFNEYPVTQEEQAVAHPVIERCVQAPTPCCRRTCAPSCSRPCCSRRRSCCGSRPSCYDGGYGYW